MLKIWSMKKEQKQAENAEGQAAGGKKKKVTAAQLRVQKDLSELSLGSTMKTEFPDPDDILNFVLTIEPDEGMYRNGRFTFDFAINQNFPHEPPKVRCRETIYHPNIDLEGKVCLNILREDWKPVLNLNAVIVGLQVGYPRFVERGCMGYCVPHGLTLVCDASSCSSSQTPRTLSIRRPPRTYDITGKALSETCACQ
ncbi:NEDD8-conjugating protein ubc12 [Purpureocillium takamizusanense]|uniref:Ubiquitin-conjugating enzyme E2 2 n=1 Tax=Purpureocillium takamizusanense TaxID=2060973 RepID=A0A9Q8QL06_9HYPO|nr:NEDD8-conjugating protein ubc12 [Purpureocillium takamizusanense]UNI20746.1 NEDD8-conjugating protein ubc12 [Purpureocillium takamizusanense]